LEEALAARPKLLVICVNYNSDSDAVALANDFLQQSASKVIQVIVADNTARGTTNPEMVLPGHHNGQVSVFSSGSNLGYFGAAAAAFAAYREKHPVPDWVAVSNADLSIPYRTFVSRLLEDDPSSCGIVAPSIRSSVTGRDQNPYMRDRPSSSRMHFYKAVFSSKLMSRFYLLLSNLKQSLRLSASVSGPGPVSSSPKSTPTEIYAPHGSFVLFGRRYFEAGGTLNHGTFLYGEEIFVAETARKLQLPVHYNRDLALVHREHTTTASVKSDVLFQYRKDAARYCADTFF